MARRRVIPTSDRLAFLTIDMTFCDWQPFPFSDISFQSRDEVFLARLNSIARICRRDSRAVRIDAFSGETSR
jgi:hypothetical protein